MRCMIVVTALLFVTAVSGAESVEVLGVARVGDGSEIAKAWAASPSDLKPVHQAEWAVQLKQTDKSMAACDGMCVRGDKQILIALRQGEGKWDWIGVSKATVSGGQTTDMLALIVNLMKRSNEPLSDEQEKKLRELITSSLHPEIQEAWEKVEAAPQDLALANTFAEKCVAAFGVKSRQDPSPKMLAVLTPAQNKIFATLMTPQVSGGVSGPDGSISHSLVTIGGKKQLTLTIDGMNCAQAMRQAVQQVNYAFQTKLGIPAIGKDLAGAKLSLKIVIDDPEQALQKIASAMGAKIDEVNGAATLVPAKN